MRAPPSSWEIDSMNDIEKAKKEGRGFYSNVRDPNLKWSKRGLNARTCTISLGPDGDQDSPVAAVVWLNSGPGDPLRGRPSPSCDAINLVVERSEGGRVGKEFVSTCIFRVSPVD